MFEESSFRSEHLGVITHGSLNEGIEMKLDPGESVEVTFTAPDTPGDRPYICTFPGHYVGGMKGTLIVE